MTEIELKAHVDDRPALRHRLKQFAEYACTVIRDDTYYGTSPQDRHKLRIRHERHLSENGTVAAEDFLVTYKRKEKRTALDGTVLEVNDERECTVSSPDALTAFLRDAGYSVQLEKHKEVEDWQTSVNNIKDADGTPVKATLEICTVPPLGDFLEIEILAPSDDETTVSLARQELSKLLEKSGIGADKIEPRYYSELLRDCT